MGNYRGVKTVIKNDRKYIHVRFKHNNKNYGVKNFTKLYGCRTEKQAFDKLTEIKILINQGKNPFITNIYNLDDIFKTKIEEKRLNKDWKKHTIDNYELYYEKVIKEPLGHKKLNKIEYQDLIEIISKLKADKKKAVWINRLKQILNPIFKEALIRREIYINPCDAIKNEEVEVGDNIYEKIVSDDIVKIAKTLYKTIPYYPVKAKDEAIKLETRTFLYLVLLSAHRIGEVIQLKKEYCYIEEMKIVSPRTITRTDKDIEFPIPDECLEHIKNVKKGLLFKNIKRASIYLMFQRLVKISKISLKNDKKLTIHDTRSLMLNIMIENGIDSKLADFCLDHKSYGTIANYISFSFKRKKEAYNTYWKLIRTNKLLIEKENFREEFFKNYEIEFEKAWKKKEASLNLTL